MLMVCGCVPAHRISALAIPSTVRLEIEPPYSTPPEARMSLAVRNQVHFSRGQQFGHRVRYTPIDFSKTPEPLNLDRLEISQAMF